jgi:transcriptional regulator with XRE-family HTH domain
MDLDLGRLLIELRKEKGIYQKELATYLEVSTGTISNYEKGVHNPDLKALCKIADFYDVSLDYMLGRTQYNHSLETLNRNLTKDFTISDFMNTVLEFSDRNVSSLLDYVELLSIREEMNQ